MGGTPLIELYVVYNELAKLLKGRGVTIARNLIGPYITSLEMAGCSITLLKPRRRADPSCGTHRSTLRAALGRLSGFPRCGSWVRPAPGRQQLARLVDRRSSDGFHGGSGGERWLRGRRPPDPHVRGRIADNKEYLTELDSAIGDADHGINMNRGMQAAKAKLEGSRQAMSAPSSRRSG